MRIVKSDREQRGARNAPTERLLSAADRPRCLQCERWAWSGMAGDAVPFARVSVPSLVAPDLLRGPCLPRLLLARLSGARPARPLDGLISPQDGKASIALPQWRRRDFLPLGLPPRKRGDPGCAHSSRAKKACPREGGGLSAAILRCASALRVRRRSPAA